MSELTEKLTKAAAGYKGTEFGGLLQWAVLHIQSQDEALASIRDELEIESNERIRLERAIHTARQQLDAIDVALTGGLPVNIDLARDHAPHINIMAHHGVAPYAKKPRKAKT